jgi:hypothetical protein
VEASPGFRGSLGFEAYGFRFSVESGESRVTGTNPFVLGIRFVPLLFKLGYRLSLPLGFSLLGELGGGLFFSQTVHYESALDLLLENTRESSTRNLLAGAKAYLAWTFPGGFIDLYLGGGIDVILETGGPIPLPALEAGLSLSLRRRRRYS